MSKNEFKIPKNQIHFVTQTVKDGTKYIVTGNTQRTKYFLYLVGEKNSLTKLKESKTPLFKELGYD